MLKRGRLNVVMGAQAGSESKGKLSSLLVKNNNVSAVVMASSPNAGHTVVLDDGTRKVSYHMPVCAIHLGGKRALGLEHTMEGTPNILLGPSSIINSEKMVGEVEALGIDPSTIMVHPRASLITKVETGKEKSMGLSDIGSTLQGVGVARMNKMKREKDMQLVGNVRDPYIEKLRDRGMVIGDTVGLLNLYLNNKHVVLAESTQGFDLCLEHGIHPRYCTSKMVNSSMVLAEAGVAPSLVGEVLGVVRTLPIRVNNRSGTSGPYTGAMELTWENVKAMCGFPGKVGELMESTTTTKLPRRIFTFSWERFNHFVRVCRPTQLCLQFANYLNWENYRVSRWHDLTHDVKSFILELERASQCRVTYVGTGPRECDMVSRDGGE